MKFHLNGKEKVKKVTWFIFLFFLLIYGIVFGDEKQWSAGGDGTAWEDPLNWFSPAVPTANDDVIIDMKDAEVLAAQNFFAKTLNIGGREKSSFTSNDFICGIIGPDSNTNNALDIKKDGLVVLKGAGDIVLKGSFKNSEESLPSEPAFMFGLE